MTTLRRRLGRLEHDEPLVPDPDDLRERIDRAEAGGDLCEMVRLYQERIRAGRWLFLPMKDREPEGRPGRNSPEPGIYPAGGSVNGLVMYDPHDPACPFRPSTEETSP
jgi:hypothetical protein